MTQEREKLEHHCDAVAKELHALTLECTLLKQDKTQLEKSKTQLEKVVVVDLQREQTRLTSKLVELEQHCTKEIAGLIVQHGLLLTAKVTEASTSARREEEERTRIVLEEMHVKMATNNQQVQTLRNDTALAERETNHALMERERFETQLIDAKKEIEENQRAVLETLKLSSEIQANEHELTALLDKEKEQHNRAKSEQENLQSRLVRAENDLERVRNQRDTLETSRLLRREKSEAQESNGKKIQLEMELLTRKFSALERDHERSIHTMKDLHEELLTAKSNQRRELDNVDALTRVLKETKLDLECEFTAHRRSQEEAVQRITEAETKAIVVEAESNVQNEKIELLRVQVTVSETTIHSLQDELESKKKENEHNSLKIRDEQHREEVARDQLILVQGVLEKTNVEIATLKERCRTFDARMDGEEQLHQSALTRERKFKNEMEKSMTRLSQENILLRKRHDMLVR